MDREAKIRELARLEAEAERLRAELAADLGGTAGPPSYYTSFHILAGMLLGFLGACASLLFNVVGATVLGKHPLELIRVYLTFPLGEAALGTNDGFTLGMGCLLYMGTGMALGIPIHVVLTRFFAGQPAAKRAGAATGMGVVLWLISYYAMLSWIQPALFGGDWIVRLVPVWVAALTHLSFAWTVFGLDELGLFHSPTAAPRLRPAAA
ncbi:MAG TPA: hypothetical protein VHF22_04105 [Planctomycetota bacterium]|nr:hypothetical protein [Planctomycetota bacterium]